MNIVVLDGYTLNPGDLSWDALARLGQVTVYDRTPAVLVNERAKDAEIVLTNKTPLSAAAIESLPRLKYIGVLATGYNVVDTSAASERGVVVTNVPDYSTGSVAQFTFALLLELCHRVGLHQDAVRHGEWTSCPDFSFTKTPQTDLEGKTMGIVGYGRIGSRVGRIAEAFGMKVLAGVSGVRKPDGRDGVERLPIPELLAESDVVSLHCPLTPETAGLINRESLALMKPTALLVNTSRGGLIVDQDLAEALAQDRIRGAALDVLPEEPPAADQPLLTAPNCIITPHMAWASLEARARLMNIAVGNVEAYLRGEPANVVNRRQ